MHGRGLRVLFGLYRSQSFKVRDHQIKIGPFPDLVVGRSSRPGKADSHNVQLQVNQRFDRVVSQKHPICGKPYTFPLALAYSDHLKEVGVEKGFSPTLQIDQVRVFQKGDERIEEFNRHMSICPTVVHEGVRTVDAQSVTVCRYLNLNPVQVGAIELVQLSFDPI